MYFLVKTNNQEVYYLIWKSWQLLGLGVKRIMRLVVIALYFKIKNDIIL